MRHAAPLVVVGGGIAGLCTALAAAPRPVLLLGRGERSEDTASTLAQGGIAAALDPADCIGAHVTDTLLAGAFRNDGALVRALAAAAPGAIEWLRGHGVDFDRDDDGDTLRLGREGGHQFARIVHAGGDATGARVVAALSREVAAASHVHWRGGIDADGLLLRNGAVVGVRLGGTGAGEVVETDAVVLATGGIGALFARTTNPVGADGSGLALALAAGARPRDLEFVQFHPTALDLPTHALPLLTEALRGRGARLVDGEGRPLMAGLHPQGDLAPRDVVSRRVWQAGCNGGAWLDSTGLGIDWRREFPTALAACVAHGIDPGAVPVPVTAAAHFHMGGVATDAVGSTSLPGLYAVGEVACNGVHGANRLASNSLLEGVVFGRRLGARLARSAHASVPFGGTVLVERGPGLSDTGLCSVRDLLWRAAGPVRTGSGLRSALAAVAPFAEASWQGRLARALIEAAACRRVNVGAHWREDSGATELLESGAV